MPIRQRQGWVQFVGVAALVLAQLGLLILIAKSWLWVVIGGPFYPLGAAMVLAIAAVGLIVAAKISGTRTVFVQVPLWAVTCASAIVAIVLVVEAFPGRLALLTPAAVALVAFVASGATYMWHRKRTSGLSRSNSSLERP